VPGNALPDKLFFKIGEVAQIVGVRAHVLRYWESEFAALRPLKTRGSHRVYRRRDVELAVLLRHLLHEEGLTIAGAKRRLRETGRREGSSREAGSREAGSREAGSREAGPREAGSREAGSREAGAREAEEHRVAAPSEPSVEQETDARAELVAMRDELYRLLSALDSVVSSDGGAGGEPLTEVSTDGRSRSGGSGVAERAGSLT
jgi:DNA-binding transcriptional MerR regulator